MQRVDRDDSAAVSTATLGAIMLSRLAVIIAVLGSAPSAVAATLFQSIPDLTAPPANFFCSDCGDGIHVFDTFTLNSTDAITSVEFAVQQFTQLPISIKFFSVTYPTAFGAEPNLLLGAFTPSSYSLVSEQNGTDLLRVDLPAAFALTAGTYDISFESSTLLIPDYLSDHGNLLSSVYGFLEGRSLGFSLEGTVVQDVPAPTPLPATWTMMLIGLAGIGLGCHLSTRVAEESQTTCIPSI
jgi:hypothetical protein